MEFKLCKILVEATAALLQQRAFHWSQSDIWWLGVQRLHQDAGVEVGKAKV